jgi:ppGpp synthetase/RelA/SpoT-type nucleotidyltranferase
LAKEKFDRDVYAAKCAAEYAECRDLYEAFSNEMHRIVINNLWLKQLKVQIVQQRAKTIASYKDKCRKLKSIDDENGKVLEELNEPKYENPIKQITDLAAIRIIAYSLGDVVAIQKMIVELFEVTENSDKGLERISKNDFGYKSIHILASFSQARYEGSPELGRFAGLTCEIQIRTILQHAWAEIEHSIRYKNKNKIDDTMKESLFAVAGLLTIGDKELQAINDTKLLAIATVTDLLANEVINAAPEEADQLSVNPDDQSRKPKTPPVKIKDLVLAGDFVGALAEYDAKIGSQPDSHTLYLGRAKARYLNGDSAGALDDIECLYNMEGQSEKILRDTDNLLAVVSGRFELADKYSDFPLTQKHNQNQIGIEKTNQPYDDYITSAKKHLEEGDARGAYLEYVSAESLGYNRAFASLNKAVCKLMSGDLDAAQFFVEQLKERPDTPMQIVIVATKLIICILNDAASEGDELRIDSEFARLKALVSRFNESVITPFLLRTQPLYWFFAHFDDSMVLPHQSQRIEDVRTLFEVG